MSINIKELTIEEKAQLIRDILNNADVTLEGHCGIYVIWSEKDITVRDNKIRIWIDTYQDNLENFEI